MRRLSSLPRRVAWPLALLVVIVVSAGSATAARKITGKDVANSSLTGRDLRDSSVTGSDIRNRSLTARDFRESIRGPQGPPGKDGGHIPTTEQSAPVVLAPGQTEDLVAYCPANMYAVSGGHYVVPVTSPPAAVYASVAASFAFYDDTLKRDVWLIRAQNLDAVPAEARAIAYCAPVPAAAATAMRRGSRELRRHLGLGGGQP
jgi:hypothetical protein